MTTAQTVNSFTGPLILVIITVLTMAMGLRLVRHFHNRRRSPLLLIRDFMTWLTFFVVAAGSYYSRSNPGVRLSEQLWWVVLTNALFLTTAFTWLAIELALVGRREDE